MTQMSFVVLTFLLYGIPLLFMGYDGQAGRVFGYWWSATESVWEGSGFADGEGTVWPGTLTFDWEPRAASSTYLKLPPSTVA